MTSGKQAVDIHHAIALDRATEDSMHRVHGSGPAQEYRGSCFSYAVVATMRIPPCCSCRSPVLHALFINSVKGVSIATMIQRGWVRSWLFPPDIQEAMHVLEGAQNAPCRSEGWLVGNRAPDRALTCLGDIYCYCVQRRPVVRASGHDISRPCRQPICART